MGRNLGSECILLAEAEMLVMLYLHGEESTCDQLVRGLWVNKLRSGHGNREGASPTPALLKFEISGV